MEFDYIKLTAAISTLIEEGEYLPGTSIPSERELCQQYNTSRTTVRRAIEDLVSKKILIKKPGKGTFVSQKPDHRIERTGNILFLRCMHSELHFDSFLTDDVIYPNILSGIEISATKSGYNCLVKTVNEKQPPLEVLDTLKGKIDGIICGELHDPHFLQYLTTFDLPLVLVSPSVDTGIADTVAIDNQNGAFLATEYLIEKGHERIAFVGGSKNSLPAEERKNGYIRAMKKSGLFIDEQMIIDTNWLQSDGYDSFLKMWKGGSKPTAIVTASDLLALGVFNGAAEIGVSIPGDLSLIGFDGISTVRHLRPVLTTMYVRALAMGEVAFNLFMQQWDGARDYPVKIAIPAELTEGESVKAI